jgi:hypothetical protein
MARAYLRQQERRGALREDVLGEDTDDLAMDAVAALFERDEQGRFPELRRYFEGRVGADVDPDALEEDLRRLVSSAVTDWLFEAYRAADRSLSNLIRALKRAVTSRNDARLRRRGRTLWVEGRRPASAGRGADAARNGDHTWAGAQPDRARPGRPMPMETLEARLTGAVAANPSTGALLGVAMKALRAHPDYEAAYPLTRLAQVMRAARIRVQAVTEHDETVSPDAPLLRTDELTTLIEQVLAEVREEKRSTYVDSGPLDEETYAAYFRALRDRLDARFVPPGDPTMTHYDALSAHRSGLSQDTYRTEHRARFEYLDQCVREALIDRLQDVV